MPSAMTTTGANFVLNTLFGKRVTPPASFYVALMSQAPGEHATGTSLSEPPANTGYARVQIPNDSTQWGEAVAGFVATTSEITFPSATDDWPIITHYALCDGLYTGNVYLYGSFQVPRQIRAGDKVTFPIGLLSLSCTSLTTVVVSSF